MVFDRETSPSHRIIIHIPIYKKQKSIAGPSVAEAIGIDLIRQNCPEYNKWVKKLENL
jgi:hypothetical protein